MNADCSIQMQADTIRLRGVLDFRTVVDIAHRGGQWLADDAPARCRVDLGEISYSNSAGIALLLDWLRTAHSNGKVIAIDNMPDDMTAIVRLGNLDTIIPLNTADDS